MHACCRWQGLHGAWPQAGHVNSGSREVLVMNSKCLRIVSRRRGCPPPSQLPCSSNSYESSARARKALPSRITEGPGPSCAFAVFFLGGGGGGGACLS